MSEPDMKDIERRMSGAVDNLKTEMGGLRSGRASAALLEPVMVDVYGSQMPINQVGTVSVPEPRMLSVSVWDANNAAAVEKAIRNSGLGLNPMAEGAVIRITIPELNEERRKELGKVAGKYAEQARISVRNVRRDGIEKVKKSSDLSEDEQHMWTDEIQGLTDKYIGQIDDMLKHKEEEIMQV